MEAALSTLDRVEGKFIAFSKEYEIQINEIVFDDVALERAINQFRRNHYFTSATQIVSIRKLVINALDYNKLMESPYFSAILKGTAYERSHRSIYMCNVEIGKFSLEQIESCSVEREDDGCLVFSNIRMILYAGGKYSADLDTSEE